MALLEPLELSVDETSDGRIAADMVTKKKYDMIFMDSHMPVMNGEEATAEIRRPDCINSTTPIIALTADAVSGVRERLIECGMIKKYLPEAKLILSISNKKCRTERKHSVRHNFYCLFENKKK